MIGLGLGAVTFLATELFIDWPPEDRTKRSRKPVYISAGSAAVVALGWWLI